MAQNPTRVSQEVADQMKHAHQAAASATPSLHPLLDGRKICHAEFGCPDGMPIIFLHGWPGSCLDAAFFHASAAKHNLRLISPDRPGCGKSDAKPGRTLLEYPDDLVELAAHLDIREFGVLGVSGGGPYAMACAYVLPPGEKCKVVSNVTGLGELATMTAKGMFWTNWFGWRFVYTWWPSFMAWYIKDWARLKFEVSDEERIRLMKKEIEESSPDEMDLEAGLLNEDCLAYAALTSRQAFLQGRARAVEDGTVIAGRWGFKVEDIREDVKLQLWFGSKDGNVGGNVGQQIKQRFRGEAELQVKDETHLSLQVHWADDIMRALARAMQE